MSAGADRSAALRVLVADDEPPARAEVARALARHPDVEVIGFAGDGLEALETILAEAPDLVFLDVQMPELSGIDVLQALAAEERPAVVFVTAYDRFALDAFEVQAVDYLLKPFDDARFDVALGRARERLARRAAPPDDFLDRLQARQPKARRLVSRAGGRVALVDVHELIRAESARNYVELHTRDGVHLTRSTLGALAAQLDPAEFLRVHRRHIVRREAIRELRRTPAGDWMLVLAGDGQVPVGRSFRPDVDEALRAT